MSKKLTHNVLIFPDIHGRSFWRRPLEVYKEKIEAGKMEVVFLGDYLDPYSFEIEEDRAENYLGCLRMLGEIVEFARGKKNVHLLLGNHDMHYFDRRYEKNIYKVRFCPSQANAKKIRNFFSENKDMFCLAWDCTIGETLYLFTHAGVLKSWVDVFFKGNKIRRPNAEFLNNILDDGKRDDILKLCSLGPYRGGWGRIPGSPIWADVHEHVYGWKNEENPGRHIQEVYKDRIYQIFAHTLSFPMVSMNEFDSFDNFYIGEHFAMLDARRAFVMDVEGNISEFK